MFGYAWSEILEFVVRFWMVGVLFIVAIAIFISGIGRGRSNSITVRGNNNVASVSGSSNVVIQQSATVSSSAPNSSVSIIQSGGDISLTGRPGGPSKKNREAVFLTLLRIEHQAGRKEGASDAKHLLEGDLEIIQKEVSDVIALLEQEWGAIDPEEGRRKHSSEILKEYKFKKW